MNLGETHVPSIALPIMMYTSIVTLVSFCLDLGFDYTSLFLLCKFFKVSIP